MKHEEEEVCGPLVLYTHCVGGLSKGVTNGNGLEPAVWGCAIGERGRGAFFKMIARDDFQQVSYPQSFSAGAW